MRVRASSLRIAITEGKRGGSPHRLAMDVVHRTKKCLVRQVVWSLCEVPHICSHHLRYRSQKMSSRATLSLTVAQYATKKYCNVSCMCMAKFLLSVFGTQPSFAAAYQCNLFILLALRAKSIMTVFVTTGITKILAHIVDTFTAIIQDFVPGTHPTCR